MAKDKANRKAGKIKGHLQLRKVGTQPKIKAASSLMARAMKYALRSTRENAKLRATPLSALKATAPTSVINAERPGTRPLIAAPTMVEATVDTTGSPEEVERMEEPRRGERTERIITLGSTR